MAYSQFLKIRDGRNGKTTYSTVTIPANTKIIEFTGTIVTDLEIPTGSKDLYLQIGPNIYMGPSGGVDDFVNHSCDPNCKMHIVGNRAFLLSLYVIPANNDLTYDYSATSTDVTETNCNCGSYKCRKVISGYHSLQNDLKESYKSKHMVPIHITHNILQPK